MQIKLMLLLQLKGLSLSNSDVIKKVHNGFSRFDIYNLLTTQVFCKMLGHLKKLFICLY